MKQKFNSWEECIQLREVKSLKQLVHPNIVKLIEVTRERNGTLYFIFEYMQGNLYQLISQRSLKLFSEFEVKRLMFQVLLGLSHMHKHGYFHRDLKPENLLTSSKDGGLIKIADFGLAREIRSLPPYTEYVSTRWYRAPEIILKSNQYSSPVDIWAMGCIFAELLTLQPLFPGTGEIDQLFKICSIVGPPFSMDPSSQGNNLRKSYSSGYIAPDRHTLMGGGCWNDGVRLASKLGFTFPSVEPVVFYELFPMASTSALELLSDMLKYDPQRRPTAHESLRSPVFSELWSSTLAKQGFDTLSPQTISIPVSQKSQVPHDSGSDDLDIDFALEMFQEKNSREFTSTPHKLPNVKMQQQPQHDRTKNALQYDHELMQRPLNQEKHQFKHGMYQNTIGSSSGSSINKLPNIIQANPPKKSLFNHSDKQPLIKTSTLLPKIQQPHNHKQENQRDEDINQLLDEINAFTSHADSTLPPPSKKSMGGGWLKSLVKKSPERKPLVLDVIGDGLHVKGFSSTQPTYAYEYATVNPKIVGAGESGQRQTWGVFSKKHLQNVKR